MDTLDTIEIVQDCVEVCKWKNTATTLNLRLRQLELLGDNMKLVRIMQCLKRINYNK